ncbi:MAG TPA: hypothetical protein VMR31_13705 [Myxococcota bacterium]|nr:hypothetical protein [Myxococcota bacterium]
MARAPAPWFLEPPWFFVTFVAMWLALTALTSRISGWARLAEEFRSDAPAAGETFRFASGSMGRRFPAKYNSCLWVVVTPAGFQLSLWLPFRFLSPTLFIPWTRVESLEEKRVFLAKRVVIRVIGCWPAISLLGKAGQAVRDAYVSARALHDRSA